MHLCAHNLSTKLLLETSCCTAGEGGLGVMSEGPGHGASVLLRGVLGLSVVSTALTVEQEPLMHVTWLAGSCLLRDPETLGLRTLTQYCCLA